MSFQSLEQILTAIENQPGWEIQLEYRRLQQAWKDLVTPVTSTNTRPLYINRKVLYVAVSSSAWAQNLSLQRYSLLKKINKTLALDLVDIRFSTVGWDGNKAEPQQNHPSFIGNEVSQTALENLSAFERWTSVWRDRAKHLPLCPKCQSPTPVGELERWGVCACCLY